MSLLHAHWQAVAELLRRHQWHRVSLAPGLKSRPPSSPPLSTPLSPPLPPLTATRQHITMGKKKHDPEASSSSTKKAERTKRVPLPIEVARLMHKNWTPCDRWRDVHLPGGSWRLSHLRVPFPPVPLREAGLYMIGRSFRYSTTRSSPLATPTRLPPWKTAYHIS
jgi:hypothetical protein